MCGSFRLLRPDDLLALDVETTNLTLNNDPQLGPALVVDKAGTSTTTSSGYRLELQSGFNVG